MENRATPRNSPPPLSPELNPPEPETHAATKKIFAESYDFVIYQLQCVSCDSIMVAPIRYCTSGHCFCNKCSNFLQLCTQCFKPLIDTCNKNLEEIAVSTGFCLFSAKGCEAKLPLSAIRDHVTRCHYLFIYCPVYITRDLACPWTGLKRDLYFHAREHPHLVFDNCENFFFRDCLKSIPPVSKHLFVIQGDEIFLYCKSWYGSTWVFAITQLAMTDRKFRCVYDIKGINSLDRIRMVMPVALADRKLDITFNEGKCLIMPNEMIQHFILGGNSMDLTVHVYCAK